MGWNGNEPNNKDQWNGKNQPPDLDEALKRLNARFKRIFSGGGSKNSSPAEEGGGGSTLLILIASVIAILWALSGIYIVDPAEQAVVLRFGKYHKTVGPGPHWIPRFIDSKLVVNVDRVSDYSYSAQMLTKDENLVSVSLAVQYRISDLEAYLFNVSDPEESLKQATSSALRQVVGTTTLDQIITEGREAWGINVQDSLIKILASYKTGIVIVNVSPQPARAPENVQDAFDDAIKAQEDEKRFREQAYAYNARVVPIAEGNAKRITAEAQAYAQQIVLRAKGETAEFLALLPEYLLSPMVTSERMYIDSMQQVLSKSTKVIVDSKSSNLLYLPLDKLISSIPAPPSSLVNKDHSNAADQQDVDGKDNRMTTRDSSRPIYRQGDM